MSDSDPVLRRIERDAIVVCVLASVVAGMVLRPHAEALAGVLGGGVLVAVSYRGIKAGADALAGATTSGARRSRRVVGLLKFLMRYAILAAAAYVIIARVRLPPVAVVVGASSGVVAIAIEAIRGAVQHRRL
jgi:hypothetical protein